MFLQIFTKFLSHLYDRMISAIQIDRSCAASVQRFAAIASVIVQALLATSILFNARKSVGSGSVFSLSFRSFLSLFIRNKRERKGHFQKLFFYFKIVLTFSSLLR